MGPATAAGRRVVVFGYAKVGSWHRDGRIESADRAYPPFRPPDISAGSNSYEVGRQTCAAGRTGPDPVLLEDPEMAVFTDERDRIGILREPDVVCTVHGNPVRVAIRRRCRDFLKRQRGGIKSANLVHEVFREPDLPI